MKKSFLFTIGIFLYHFCIAQNSPTPPAVLPSSNSNTTPVVLTTPAVTMHGSFVTTGNVIVNPYIEVPAGSTKQIDLKIHFRIKKGDKFTIEKPIIENNVTQGYVVKVWQYRYKDTIRLSHKKFYDSLVNNQKSGSEAAQAKSATLAQKKKAINIAVNDSVVVAKKVDTIKVTFDAVQKMFSDATQRLVITGLSTNATKTLIPPGAPANKQHAIKPEVSAFIKAQDKLKASQESSQYKSDLIDAIVKLPSIPDTLLANSKAEYTALKKRYSNLQANLTNFINDLSSKTEKIKALRSDYQNESSQIYLAGTQDNNPAVDKNSYRRTKEQSGEQTGTRDDLSSPYAPYAGLEFLDDWANGWQFYMSANDFASNAITVFPRSNSFTWGFLTLPIKMRFDNNLPGGRFNFEQNLNFGLTAGIRHQFPRIDDFSINYLGGLSVVNVPLNNATTNSTATTTAAISLSGGAMLQYNKFQIGIFLGRDFAGDHASQFAYQGKPWVGFAIGISLFGAGQTTATTPTQ